VTTSHLAVLFLQSKPCMKLKVQNYTESMKDGHTVFGFFILLSDYMAFCLYLVFLIVEILLYILLSSKLNVVVYHI